MALPKRKNVFLTSYENEYSGIKRSKKGDEYAHCDVCNCEINLTSIGKTAIKIHFDSDKHKNALRAQKTSETIKSFTVSSVSNPIDRQVLAAEGSFSLEFMKFI